MPADPNQVIANLRELAALTSDANGAQRIAFTPTWQRLATALLSAPWPIPCPGVSRVSAGATPALRRARRAPEGVPQGCLRVLNHCNG